MTFREKGKRRERERRRGVESDTAGGRWAGWGEKERKGETGKGSNKQGSLVWGSGIQFYNRPLTLLGWDIRSVTCAPTTLTEETPKKTGRDININSSMSLKTGLLLG